MRRGSPLSRALAFALLLLAGVAALRLIVLPVLAVYHEATASIEHSRMLLRRYRTLAAQRPQLEGQLAAQQRAAAESAAYLEASSDALAAAALQDRVRTLIERADGELRSTQTLPVQTAGPKGGIDRVGIRLQLVVDLEGLKQLLYESETTEPYLFVDGLSIRGRHLGRQDTETEDRALLEVDLEVFGYRRAGS